MNPAWIAPSGAFPGGREAARLLIRACARRDGLVLVPDPLKSFSPDRWWRQLPGYGAAPPLCDMRRPVQFSLVPKKSQSPRRPSAGTSPVATADHMSRPPRIGGKRKKPRPDRAERGLRDPRRRQHAPAEAIIDWDTFEAKNCATPPTPLPTSPARGHAEIRR
jgi:hypothetical protein